MTVAISSSYESHTFNATNCHMRVVKWSFWRISSNTVLRVRKSLSLNSQLIIILYRCMWRSTYRILLILLLDKLIAGTYLNDAYDSRNISTFSWSATIWWRNEQHLQLITLAKWFFYFSTVNSVYVGEFFCLLDSCPSFWWVPISHLADPCCCIWTSSSSNNACKASNLFDEYWQEYEEYEF